MRLKVITKAKPLPEPYPPSTRLASISPVTYLAHCREQLSGMHLARSLAATAFLVSLGAVMAAVDARTTSKRLIPSHDAGSTSDLRQPPVTFVDEAAEAGVILMNVSGSREKRYIIETTGAGACFFDYDLDGDMDLYLVNGARLETIGPANPVRNTLYRNNGDGSFTDVTVQAGVGDNGWGGGCSVADYDNDGDPDLYITNYGPNVLYRNEGHGTFFDVTVKAGVGDDRWSAGAVFVDIDRDGDLDLYVANYLRFNIADLGRYSSGCYWKGAPVMCGPRGFEGEADVLYRNNGDGSFTDISDQANVAGSALFGLGVLAGDVDEDGDTDIFVANDSQMNLLFLNDGRGRFEERGLVAGVALSGDGRKQAGMGVDLGDYDGDGDQDLFVTNFSDDYHTLYRNDGGGLFTDVSLIAGLDPATRSSLGWGGGFFDYDNDGDLDLFIAGGHVYPDVGTHDPLTTYRQRNLLFRNEGNGRFTDVTERSGPGLALVQPSRGVAFGDYDDDGDLDIIVVNENEVPALLRNDGGNANHWFKVRLIGTRSNRDGVGARLRLHAGGHTQVREVRVNGSFYSSHDPRIHFGLGDETSVKRLEVRWPSGTEQVLADLPADHLVTIDEALGVVSIISLRGPGRTPGPLLLAETSPSEPAPAPPAVGAARTSGPQTTRLTATDLREIDILVRAGTRRIMSGQYAAGIAAYEQALAPLPNWEAAAESPDALGFGHPERYRAFLSALYDNLGVGLMRSERLDECAVAIGRAIAISPGRAKFHHNLGLCHFHARRYGEAIAALQVARSASEPSTGIYYDLGRALALAGRCDEGVGELGLALQQLPRPDLKGRRAETWYHLGSCHAIRGRQAEGAHAFREVLALVPGHQKALYKLGLALRRKGKFEAADRVHDLFQARQPADEAVRSMKRAGARLPVDRLRLARAYLDAGLPPQALREARTALAANPENSSALLLLGEASLALRPPRFDMAEKAFQDVLRKNPTDADALSGLGETYRLSGRLDQAAQLFSKALAIRPGHVGATIGVARIAFASGRTEQAVVKLQKVLRRSPADSAALRALAEIYVSSTAGPHTKPREALRLLDRAGGLYGEGIESRLRALVLLGERVEARKLIEESPFLGEAERIKLSRIMKAK